jgi:hypothetical protein
MRPLTDQDWEQVNAWADGELPEPQARAFGKRLEAEPALAEALASVRQVSRALSATRSEQTIPTPNANRNRRPWIWAAGAALTASVAAAAVVAFLMFSTLPNAIDVHRDYAAQSYQLPDKSDLRRISAASVDGFPSLGDANLVLVAVDTQTDRASAHFAGVNGCRLTVLRGNYTPPEVSADVQMHQWLAENSRYQVIATGMDAGKFAATATYLEQVTQNRLQDSTVLALREAVQSSTTCRRALS